MDWLVVNAVSRDVERQHLNKILKDIRGVVTSLQQSDATINAKLNANSGTVLEAFTLKLAGAVSGTGNVNGDKVVTIQTTMAGSSFVQEPDNNGKVYGRKYGEWVIPTTKDVKESTNLYFTKDRAAQAVVDAIDAGTSDGIYVEYDSGTIDLHVLANTLSDSYPNGEATTLLRGQPVCIVSGELRIATNTAPYNYPVGVVSDDEIKPGEEGFVKTDGPLAQSLSDWDAITGGSGGLTAEAEYYVDSSGQLTTTPPSTTAFSIGYAAGIDELIVRVRQYLRRQTYASPVETPDGVLTTFTTPSSYLPNTLVVTLNGLVEPITELTDTTFSFVDPPLSTDTIYLDYF